MLLRTLVVAMLLFFAGTAPAQDSAPRRDLAADERCGGHTLSRHVGWTDAQLAERLRRQDISAASTYTDRETAERIVGLTLARERARVEAWTRRKGRRPNLVLRYRGDPRGDPIGRSLRRGTRRSQPCYDAVVVLRWDERRNAFCVLTSYPEVRR
ncbi:MAG TPA: RNase A-like domain-containing protein [Vicinamibacterales bacterium]